MFGTPQCQIRRPEGDQLEYVCCYLLPALVTCTAQLVNLQLPLWRGTGGTPCVSCRGDEVEDDLQHGTMDAASLVL